MHITNPEIRASDARLRLETWHTFLSRLSKSSSGFPDEILCELLGNTSVIAMAEVESFMRDLVESIVHTINESNYPVNLLQPQLHALHAHEKFDSICKMQSQNSSYWQFRLDITHYHLSNELAKLPRPSRNHPQPPLRGNTIRLRDITEVGRILCFPHEISSIIEVRQQTALTKLANYRNQYAHAATAPMEIFPSPEREVSNVIRYVSDIIKILDILAAEWKSVIEDETFLA